MNASRLAVWIVGAAVSGAWLASAAGITRQARQIPSIPAPPDVVQFDALAADVETQAGRLRERLASAPVPRAARNPFTFAVSPPRRPAPRIVAAEPALPAPAAGFAEPVEPNLELIGIAASEKPDGLVRTAMITGAYDDLIMVTVGQRILSRYDVISIGDNLVELKDVTTGGIRRLVLR
jgi:hypothetical protein